MSKITNRFVHFKTKASFTSRLGAGDIQESSVVFIQDANEIWTHGTYYKCDISEAEVIALINSKGYITEADIPSLTGGAAATSGQYVSGVTVSGHNVTVTKAALPTSVSGNAGTATKLATSRVIAIAGAVQGSATFDGSSNVSINSTLNGFDASKITSGTLNADRLPEIPISKIPAAAMERLYVVESQSAAMSLTIQEGDVVQIGSGGPMYFCVSESASTFPTKFKVFTAGAATSVPWSGVTNAPTKLSQFNNDAGYLTSVPAQTWESITGKPTFATVATSGSYNDLTNKPTIPSAYTLPTASSTVLGGVKIGSGINISSGAISATYLSVGAAAASHTHTASQVTGLATVATSGSYNDLTNKPSIPSLDGYATESWVGTQNFITMPEDLAEDRIVIGAGTNSVTSKRLKTINGVSLLVDDIHNVTNYNISRVFPWYEFTGYGNITGLYSYSFDGVGQLIPVEYKNRAYTNLPVDGESFVGTLQPYKYTAANNWSVRAFLTSENTGKMYTGVFNMGQSALINWIEIGKDITSSEIVSALGFTPISSNEIPVALPNPYALTINGTSYTGSSAVSINTARILSTATLSSSTVSAGYSYNNTSSKIISSLSGFSSSNPDSVIISTAKLTFTASNAIKMDDLANLSGTYYIYCLSYMANGKIAVNGAVYA